MTSCGCHYYTIRKIIICVKQLDNHMTSCYPRWRRAGNLKVKIGDTQTLFCMTLVAGLSTEIWNKAVLPTIKRPFALRGEIRLNSVQTGLVFVVQLTFTNSVYLLQLNTFRWKTRFNSLSTDFPHLFERITIDHINNAVYLPLLLDGPPSIGLCWSTPHLRLGWRVSTVLIDCQNVI